MEKNVVKRTALKAYFKNYEFGFSTVYSFGNETGWNQVFNHVTNIAIEPKN